MSKQADAVVALALKQVGFKEGKNNKNPYGAYFKMDNVAYCGLGISWVFNQLKLKKLIAGQYNWGFAGVVNALEGFKAKGLTVPKKSIKAGCIVFESFNGDKIPEHVELAIGSPKNGVVRCVGWNTSPEHAAGSQANGGGCYIRTRPLAFIVGVVQPAYK